LSVAEQYESLSVAEENLSQKDNRILDTSVLVKPSQIHPEREKYVKLLEQL